MYKCKSIDNKEKCVNRIFSTSLFIGCLLFVAARGYKCIQKYLEKLEAIDVRFDYTGNLDFPSFTICPHDQNEKFEDHFPKHFNLDVLKECNLTLDEYNGGLFATAKGHPDCTNPKRLRNKVFARFEDFQLKRIIFRTYDSNGISSVQVNMLINDTSLQWTRIPQKSKIYNIHSFQKC